MALEEIAEAINLVVDHGLDIEDSPLIEKGQESRASLTMDVVIVGRPK